MYSCRRLTVFDEPVAPWVEHMITKTFFTGSISPSKSYVLSWNQVQHLKLHIQQKADSHSHIVVPEEILEETLHLESIRAILIHSQRIRLVKRKSGDVPLTFDMTALALSARGVAFDCEEESYNLLMEMSQKRQYDSPFWLSVNEVGYFFSCQRLQMLCNCDLSRMRNRSEEVPYVELKIQGGRHKVVNLSEFSRPTQNGNRSLNHMWTFSIFREFTPLNVLTRDRFPLDIEAALRKYSILCGCWCTIWGKPHDFEALGIKIKEGAIGLWFFDAIGSPLFLVNAFACEDVKSAFSQVYSDDLLGGDL